MMTLCLQNGAQYTCRTLNYYKTYSPILQKVCCIKYQNKSNVVLQRYQSNVTIENKMDVFDRKVKRMQRNWTASLDDPSVYDYLKDEFGWRLYDRILDIKRTYDIAVDLGCGRGHVSKHITKETAKYIYQCDMAEKVLDQSEISSEVPTKKLVVDEEYLPFETNSIDIIYSNLSLHWVNDLPGTFHQVKNCLKNDGVFIGCMFGGETLFELRVALQLAETEIEGGFGVHISPFTSGPDLGNLLQRARFSLITVDVDGMVVNYPSMKDLMKDLQGMGENNCSHKRKSMIHRKTLKLAETKYKEMFGNEDGSIPATFQVVYFIGWKPDPSQAKAAPRGSGDVSLKDIENIESIAKEYGSINIDNDKKK